ncbi:MAG: hypothetical protein IE916_12025, partial [Epsilonproteobacteria bacterium]|nr:hypothetical protein [Campylobacterota bacterium]
YDYAYRQHDIYFTELNDGTKDPRITGSVTTGVPIEVGLYIKNKVEPDIAVDNLFLSVDINTSQATYIRNTTQLTPINEIYPEDIADSFMSVADSYIHNIPVGSIESQGYFYGYYQINPKVTSIDLPIDVTANFDMTIGTTTIPSPPIKLGKKMSLCTDNNFRYQPAKSIFNMVHQGYYDKDAGGTREYYNLPTQVVNRPGDFKVIALDPNDLDTLINVSTIVAVDLVDLSAFHDSNASCQQLSSAISPRIWIPFNNSNTASFNTAAIQTAIAEGRTSVSDATSFYANARPHTTFRITFNTTNDGNDDLVKTEVTTDGKYKILNFTELVQTIRNCAQDVDGNPNNTDTVASSCGNAGNTGITIDQLSTCMECVYGYNTKFICSR